MMSRHPQVLYSLIMLVILIAPLSLSAISQSSLLYLTFEPGARANGMARAFTAVVDDAYAGWWNPGAIAFNRKTQLAATHMPWLQNSGMNDMFHEYLAWNQYFDGIGNLGANIVWMDEGTQMEMDENGIEVGEFHTFEMAFAATYGYELIPRKLGLGANFKLIYSYLGPGQGNTDTEGKSFGFAFDLGSKFQDIAGIPGLQAAAVLQNVGPDITYVNDSQSDPLPMTLRVGTAYKALDNPMNRLTVSAEASKILANEDPLLQRFVTGFEHIEETILSAGAEYTYLDLISLRGGYYYDQAGKVTGPGFGVGFQYSFNQKYQLNADFGMIWGGELTNDYNKVFSLGFEF